MKISLKTFFLISFFNFQEMKYLKELGMTPKMEVYKNTIKLIILGTSYLSKVNKYTTPV